MSKRAKWGAALGLLGALIVGFFILDGSFFANRSNGVLAHRDVTLFKSPTCGCCKNYSTYLEERGDARVQTVDRMNMTPIKRKLGIPGQLESCHTTVIGDYIVEGHVPLQAVQKLLAERPDIRGIALPGMPYGSPGMNGLKTERFKIFAINHDGSYTPYMEL